MAPTLDSRPQKGYDCKYPSSVCGNVLLNKADASILSELKIDYLDWNTSLTCGNGWTGVCTDRNGKVTELNLYSVELGTRTIPNSIGNLDKLIYLNLAFQSFDGVMILPVAKLSSLRELDLSGNDLSTFPSSFSALSNLVSLTLEDCNLRDSAFDVITKFKSLKYLDVLANFELAEIPASISSLSNLTSLFLSTNSLTTIPSSLGQLSKLEYLNLGYNSLTDNIYPTIVRLKSLRTLFLEGNELTIIPDTISLLSNLKYLSIYRNRLKAVPSSLAALENLIQLDVGDNILRTLPSTFSTLNNLQSLIIYNNDVDRSVLPIISSMKNLRTLNLGSNPKLRGPIPQLSTLPFLTHIDLSYCSFTGSIPPHFGTYPKSYVDLTSNSLCGNIPITFANFSKSGYVDLSENFLSGTIPASVQSRFCNSKNFSVYGNCLVTTNKNCFFKEYPEIARCTAACYPIPDLSKDLAYKATTKQSSTYWVANSSLAVDGTAGLGSFFNASCTHTLNQTTPWLRIGLKSTYKIRIVQIYNRLDCCSARLDGVQVYVGSSNVAYNAAGNSACTNPGYKYAPGKKGFPLNVTCNKSGKFVWVVLPGVKKILSVCEVVVLQ